MANIYLEFKTDTKLIGIEEIKFSFMDKESIRLSCIKIYRYLLWKRDYNNYKYKIAGKFNEFSNNYSISIRNLLKDYNQNRNKEDKITMSKLRNRIEKMVEFGLLKIEIINKKTQYSFCRTFHDTEQHKEQHEKQHTEKEPSSIENTKVEEKNSECSLLDISLDIDNTTKAEKFDYKNYIKNSPKATSEQIAIKAHEIFRSLKIRSMDYKIKIMESLMEQSGKITLKGLENYIVKTVKEHQNYEKQCFRKYRLFNKHCQQNFKGRGADYYIGKAEQLAEAY